MSHGKDGAHLAVTEFKVEAKILTSEVLDILHQLV